MTQNVGNILIAKSRVKGVINRIFFAIFAAVLAMAIAPSVFPFYWFGAYIVTQIIDHYLFFKAIKNGLRNSIKVKDGRLLASLCVSAIVYSSLSVYVWFYGDDVGRLFALISLCSVLINAIFTLYHSKRFMYAVYIPHAAYLIGLPVATMLLARKDIDWRMLAVIFAAATLLGYMAFGIRTFNRTIAKSNLSKEKAHAARGLAETANNAKSNFLAVISHEIRTPMNAVISSIYLLKQTALTEAQEEHVSLLNEASNVLLGLLNDVLDISKIEAGKMEIEMEPLALREALSIITRLWQPSIDEKNLNIQLNIDENVSNLVATDPLRLKQILFNLLSNAVKFTEQGTLYVRVNIDKTAQPHMLIFEIEDTGIGIVSDKLETIFLGFEQAQIGTSRRYGGTGLGLSISRRLARLMQGELSVYSKLHVGSLFRLSLPYHPLEEHTLTNMALTDHVDKTNLLPKPNHIVSANDKQAKKRVLIVDDNQANRRIMSLLISPLKLEHSFAINGFEAINLCQEQAFDLILMDMQMPIMNGIDASRNIRKSQGINQNTPIIAISANVLEAQKSQWEQIGIVDFLNKPIDATLLLKMITRILKSKDTQYAS